MAYVEIMEDEFDVFMESNGFSELILDGVNEKIYAKSYGDLSIRIFSTIEAGISRDIGKDAIRAIIHSDKLSSQVGGAKKTLRTGDSALSVFERLGKKIESLEETVKFYSHLFDSMTLIELEKSTDILNHVGKVSVLITSVKEGRTSKDDLKYFVSMRTNCVLMDGTPVCLSTNIKSSDIDNIFLNPEPGNIYSLIGLTGDISESNNNGRAVYVTIGKYNYVFRQTDLFLTLFLNKELEAEPNEVDITMDLQDMDKVPIIYEPHSGDTAISTMEEEDIEVIDEKQTTIEESSGIHISDTYLKGKYDFNLNPMQKLVWESNAIQNNENIVVSSPTASGKTVIAELCIQKAIDKYKVGIYLAPMKSLAEEKMEDWAELFPDEKIMILTGDYELSDSQKKELNEADIIIMTNEMLSSRCIKHKSENNLWLKEVDCLIVDEAHLIASEGRGDKLEVALMQFTKINPKAQLVLLSATLGELEILQNWISVLTERTTQLIKSDYRPCKLNISYAPFDNYKGNWHFEPKMAVTKSLVMDHQDDKHLIFCSSRNDSVRTATELKKMGFKAEFHNATLTLSERSGIEDDFKYGNLQIISATPTLSVGVNLPAKRVIVQSVYRGMNPITAMEVQQCVGRAGRPSYDKEGFATIILPKSSFKVDKARVQSYGLESVLTRERDLLFHLNNMIYMNEIYNMESATNWWNRTLAYQLTELEIDIDYFIDKLKKMGMIEFITSGEETLIQSGKLGRISALLYQYPDDVLTWKSSFGHIRQENLFENDFWLAAAMTCQSQIESAPYVSKDEKLTVQEFWEIIPNITEEIRKNIDDVFIKYMMHNYWALTDERKKYGSKSVISNIRKDSDRMFACVKLIDAMFGWGDKTEWETLSLRVKYGVPREAIHLVKIKGIGRIRALQLLNRNIYNAHDISMSKPIVRQLLGDRIGNNVIAQADKILGKNVARRVGPNV